MCKFPLLKAFYIVYYVSASKNGISSTELSRKLELRQKTCWLFRQKVITGQKKGRQSAASIFSLFLVTPKDFYNNS
jgi:hypothetical protein